MNTFKYVLTVMGIVCFWQASAYAIDLENLDWTVEYIIDTSQPDFGESQNGAPRDNRGLAISPDGRYLYAGYNNGAQVRKIDLTVTDDIDASVARVTGVRGKGIAVDDVGRVYLAEGDSIQVFDENLSAGQFSITSFTNTEGVAVKRVAGPTGDRLMLYAADRATGQLTRWTLTETGGVITDAEQDLDFGGGGSVAVGTGPRSVEVDGDGRIWVTAKDSNELYRVSANGSDVDSLAVGSPQDVAFDGTTVLVTRYTARTIARFDANTLLSLGDDIAVPWPTLSLDPDGQSSLGALSGLVVVPDGLYVTNETGQTADERSIYGREDTESGPLDGTTYMDLTHDDNDPILFAGPPPPPPVSPINPIPEPSILALLGSAAFMGLLVRASRRLKQRY